MARENIQTDVVVAGSGLAGLVSSVRALEHGADVILLEKGPKPGGTTIVTGGAFCVREDRELQIAPYEPLEDGVRWLEEIGVTVREVEERWGPLIEVEGCKKRIDPPDFVNHMIELIKDMGGEVCLETPLNELITNDQNEIIGLTAHSPEGKLIEIEADSVILATGGYNGNEKLVEQFLPNDVDDIWLRQDPWSTGDGFLAAQKVGGKTTRGLRIPYGHSMAGPPARMAFNDLRDGTQYYETTSIAIDERGKRFADESRVAIGSHGFIQDLINKAGGEAFLVIDQDIYDSTWPHINVQSRVENARDLGAPIVEADTLEELGEGLGEHGIDGTTAIETIHDFNDKVNQGRTDELDPPRISRQIPVETPPLRAIGVRAGVSFFFGGLDVNENAQVLARSNSTSTIPLYPSNAGEIKLEPIKGLYAAGVEVGRPDSEGYYTAGLALGLATGRIAGKHAALNT